MFGTFSCSFRCYHHIEFIIFAKLFHYAAHHIGCPASVNRYAPEFSQQPTQTVRLEKFFFTRKRTGRSIYQ